MSTEMVAELEAMTLRDYFERGLKSPEICQLVEGFLNTMHRKEQRININKQSFLAKNTRLVDELKNKCCFDFLKTEFLSLVQGRYSLKVAYDLINKQKQLEELTRENFDYKNPYQKHDSRREEP